MYLEMTEIARLRAPLVISLGLAEKPRPQCGSHLVMTVLARPSFRKRPYLLVWSDFLALCIPFGKSRCGMSLHEPPRLDVFHPLYILLR